MKFVFLSRHALTAEQKADLIEQGFTEFETVNPGVLSSAEDVLHLAHIHDAQGVGLVAPGRIWVALASYPDLDSSYYEAESRQAPELRVGDGPIPFVHVKWHKVTP